MALLKIGIAGYMGSGKSCCAKYLSRNGGTIINADMIAKYIMNTDSKIKKSLTDKFGGDILCENNILFSFLGKISFSSMHNLLILNNIIHPPLIERLRSIITESNEKLCILDAALISYWNIEDWFDILYWIRASKETRFKRLLQSVAISSDELKNRIELQENLFLEPTEGNWVIIPNEGTMKEFEKAIEKNSSTYV